MNVVEALLQDDALLGQHLDGNGLEKMRVSLIKVRGRRAPELDSYEYDNGDPRGLHAGELVRETDDGFAGLKEAPMG